VCAARAAGVSASRDALIAATQGFAARRTAAGAAAHAGANGAQEARTDAQLVSRGALRLHAAARQRFVVKRLGGVQRKDAPRRCSCHAAAARPPRGARAQRRAARVARSAHVVRAPGSRCGGSEAARARGVGVRNRAAARRRRSAAQRRRERHAAPAAYLRGCPARARAPAARKSVCR
jgi:hypothetical protein